MKYRYSFAIFLALFCLVLPRPCLADGIPDLIGEQEDDPDMHGGGVCDCCNESIQSSNCLDGGIAVVCSGIFCDSHDNCLLTCLTLDCNAICAALESISCEYFAHCPPGQQVADCHIEDDGPPGCSMIYDHCPPSVQCLCDPAVWTCEENGGGDSDGDGDAGEPTPTPTPPGGGDPPQCTPPQAFCFDECCDYPEEYCIGDWPEHECCEAWRIRLIDGDPVCCEPHNLCGETCCNDKEVCLSHADSNCCPRDQVCGTVCCPPDSQCIQDSDIAIGGEQDVCIPNSTPEPTPTPTPTPAASPTPTPPPPPGGGDDIPYLR